jgi:NADH:ubiquinone oxidoreductase subunit 5 (subunit L)/multisubunit Na+/H+ antiporter MnhA subunit
MSKWAIISSGLLAGREAALLVLLGLVALMTSAVTLACYVKFFGMTFTASGIEWSGKKDVREVGVTMLLPKAVLAAACIVQGMLPWAFILGIAKIFGSAEGSFIREAFSDAAIQGTLVGKGMGLIVNLPGGFVTAAAATPVVIAVVFAATYGGAALLRRSGGGRERQAPLWLCGYQQHADFNRYRSRNMFAAFKNFMKWTGGNTNGA